MLENINPSMIKAQSVGCQTDDLMLGSLTFSPEPPQLMNGESVLTFAENRNKSKFKKKKYIGP